MRVEAEDQEGRRHRHHGAVVASMVCIGMQEDLVRTKEYLLWVALCSHKGREN